MRAGGVAKGRNGNGAEGEGVATAVQPGCGEALPINAVAFLSFVLKSRQLAPEISKGLTGRRIPFRVCLDPYY
jgi:hypothetical protein